MGATITRRGARALSVLLVLAVTGCGAASATSASHSGGAQPAAGTAAIDRLAAVARQRYAEQVGGAHSIQTLHRVGSDPTLLRLLGSRNPSAARAYIARRFRDVWYHWHVSRMRITQGTRLVSEQGVPFVLPASRMTLREPGGRTLGTLAVSMQDEIGFVRLMHREYPSLQVVIRSRRTHELRTSLHSAASVTLPSSGSVSLGGHRYLVRSFSEKAWGGDTVTIWLLVKS